MFQAVFRLDHWGCEKRLWASSCLSIHMEQIHFHRTDFQEIWYFSIFRKTVEKLKLHANLTRISGALHWDLCTFLIISRLILLKMRKFSKKICMEKQNTHFMFSNFFFDNLTIFEVIRKKLYSRTGHGWQYGACALRAGNLRLKTHTQNM